MLNKTRALILAFLSITYSYQAMGQSKLTAKFDTEKMQFVGTNHQQATYLLRYVQKYAHLGDTLTTLPVFLDSILNGEIKVVRKKKLQKYLNASNIADEEIGGSLDSAICAVSGIKASYFVIHDTSNFLKDSTAFPINIDSVSWSGNRLDNKRTFKFTHIFINRLGASITSNNLSQQIHATKFESPIKNPLLNKSVVGSFIHIEVIQPRIADPGKKNDAIAIIPGFTDLQYKRLALIYIVASFRKGEWLIPTFHAVLDDGIPDGHDDPQNFELGKFDGAIRTLVHLLK
ncbi:hypothetical protein GM921_07400 [Pedobacter sp. LMG 31464]|uniref:Uncharacterized protein n=1 Tax=Pedobacter planticolens TaxID=2679964 RepID=A0A923IWL3_9SPHI|nr:hypothetical protein [Pedobacter planticolens]MBB2145302.1 hypothetical protein [Pedobacter planticolens]